MPFLAMDDQTKIYYEDRGQGRPVVLLHGSMCDRGSWSMCTEHLLKQGYRVIAYDMRGHGASDVPTRGMKMPQFARDLEELLAYLELTDVLLVGWSMGGLVLMEYVDLFGCDRLKKVVLVDIGPKMVSDETWPHGLNKGQYTHAVAREQLRLIEMDYEGYCYDVVSRDGESNTPELVLESVRAKLWYPPRLAASIVADMAMVDYRESVSKIAVPALIMYADPGTLFTPADAEAMHRKMPNSRLCPILGGTHIFPIRMPDVFHRLLIEFFDE